MEPFVRLDAIAAPLPIPNIDTDKILAGQFLKTISREGLGERLFWVMRQDPAFILNRPPWNAAGVLIALDNFGCGSSREHAPWALLDFGIKCVIAPSIADIFYNNCCKNGILPIKLPEMVVQRLLVLASEPQTARVHVDLITQTVASADGISERFEIDGRRKHDLIDGIDDIARSLEQDVAIARFEARRQAETAWINAVEL